MKLQKAGLAPTNKVNSTHHVKFKSRILSASIKQMSALMLKFETLAGEAFAFLETNFGFKRCLLAEGLLRYETEDVFVGVGYDGRRSFELSVAIGQRKSAEGIPFKFGEVWRSVKAPEVLPSSYQVTSEESLKRFLKEFAQALQQYGASLLQNDSAAFARLLQLRQRECKQYALEQDLRLARTEAEAAWRKKDYLAVIDALKPLRAALTATEVGKLEFAERQTSHPGSRS